MGILALFLTPVFWGARNWVVFVSFILALRAKQIYVIGVQGTPIRPTESSILIFRYWGILPQAPFCYRGARHPYKAYGPGALYHCIQWPAGHCIGPYGPCYIGHRGATPRAL